MTKFCPKCQENLPTSVFNKANRRDGLRSWCKTCERGYQQGKIGELRAQVYRKLGDNCCRCGFADKRALQIDHVFGGGNKEHAEIKNNGRFLQKVLDDASGTYQILCANCNWIKRHERLEVVKDYKLSEEGRVRLSERGKSWSPNEGQLQKMKESHQGQVISSETRVKLKQTTADSWKDAEVRASRIAGQTGKTRTPEQKANMSLVAFKREAAKRGDYAIQSA